jgi:hypothetical protein
MEAEGDMAVATVVAADEEVGEGEVSRGPPRSMLRPPANTHFGPCHITALQTFLVALLTSRRPQRTRWRWTWWRRRPRWLPRWTTT